VRHLTVGLIALIACSDNGVGDGDSPNTDDLANVDREDLPIQEHCGDVSSDEVWTASFRHVVTCDVSVGSDSQPAELTIEPGVLVVFDAATALLVENGGLVVGGSSDEPVLMTSEDEWAGISVAASADLEIVNTVLEAAHGVEAAGVTFGNSERLRLSPEADHRFVIVSEAASTRIEDVVVRDSVNSGVMVQSPSQEVRGLEIDNVGRHGLYWNPMSLNSELSEYKLTNVDGVPLIAPPHAFRGLAPAAEVSTNADVGVVIYTSLRGIDDLTVLEDPVRPISLPVFPGGYSIDTGFSTLGSSLEIASGVEIGIDLPAGVSLAVEGSLEADGTVWTSNLPVQIDVIGPEGAAELPTVHFAGAELHNVGLRLESVSQAYLEETTLRGDAGLELSDVELFMNGFDLETTRNRAVTIESDIERMDSEPLRIVSGDVAVEHTVTYEHGFFLLVAGDQIVGDYVVPERFRSEEPLYLPALDGDYVFEDGLYIDLQRTALVNDVALEIEAGASLLMQNIIDLRFSSHMWRYDHTQLKIDAASDPVMIAGIGPDSGFGGVHLYVGGADVDGLTISNVNITLYGSPALSLVTLPDELASSRTLRNVQIENVLGIGLQLDAPATLQNVSISGISAAEPIGLGSHHGTGLLLGPNSQLGDGLSMSQVAIDQVDTELVEFALADGWSPVSADFLDGIVAGSRNPGSAIPDPATDLWPRVGLTGQRRKVQGESIVAIGFEQADIYSAEVAFDALPSEWPLAAPYLPLLGFGFSHVPDVATREYRARTGDYSGVQLGPAPAGREWCGVTTSLAATVENLTVVGAGGCADLGTAAVRVVGTSSFIGGSVVDAVDVGISCELFGTASGVTITNAGGADSVGCN